MAWTAPATFTVGQVLTAATLNAQVRDNDLYLKGDSAWTAATYATGWADFSGVFFGAGYRRVGDFVVLRGLAKTTGGSTGTIFTLPVGYRPSASLSFADNNNGGFGYINVTGAGIVSTNSPPAIGGYVALDGIWIPVV